MKPNMLVKNETYVTCAVTVVSYHAEYQGPETFLTIKSKTDSRKKKNKQTKNKETVYVIGGSGLKLFLNVRSL